MSSKPVGFWKKGLQRLTVGICYGLTRLIYRLDIQGQEHIPSAGPYVVVSNHQSIFDVPIMFHLIRPYPQVLAKQELFRNPLARYFLRLMGAVPVDRQQAGTRAVRDLIHILRSGGIVGLYPEATRIRRGKVPGSVRPKAGSLFIARRLGCPILPLAIEYPLRAFHRTRVCIGPSYRVEALEEGQKLSEEQLGQRMMQRLYALVDYDYPEIPISSEEEVPS